MYLRCGNPKNEFLGYSLFVVDFTVNYRDIEANIYVSHAYFRMYVCIYLPIYKHSIQVAYKISRFNMGCQGFSVKCTHIYAYACDCVCELTSEGEGHIYVAFKKFFPSAFVFLLISLWYVFCALAFRRLTASWQLSAPATSSNANSAYICGECCR